MPRIPDLGGHRVYGFAPARHYGVLHAVRIQVSFYGLGPALDAFAQKKS